MSKAGKSMNEEDLMNKKLVVHVAASVLLTLGALGSGYAQSESRCLQ